MKKESILMVLTKEELDTLNKLYLKYCTDTGSIIPRITWIKKILGIEVTK